MDNRQLTESVDNRDVIEEIAHECGLPIEEVQDVYATERGKLERTARIKDYVPVLVSRRVKILLHEEARRSA